MLSVVAVTGISSATRLTATVYWSYIMLGQFFYREEELLNKLYSHNYTPIIQL